ncbi:MAG: hypothetical protein H6658_15865 [Ardenticatenaceae bacterium]|nr:hypothetical protein [Ardenticatenaceae bacterium]
MTLLKRVAISKKNQIHKDTATKLLALQDQPKVESWHREMEAEIRRKKIRPGRAY